MRFVEATIFLVLSALVAIFVTAWLTLALQIVGEVAQGESARDLLGLVNPLAWAMIMFFGGYFALIPTTVLLGLAFFSARYFDVGHRSAGLLVGFLHAVIGNLLKFSDLLPSDEVPNIWPYVMSGFGLIEVLPDGSALLAIPASALGGWLAGAFFTRFTRPIPPVSSAKSLA